MAKQFSRVSDPGFEPVLTRRSSEFIAEMFGREFAVEHRNQAVTLTRIATRSFAPREPDARRTGQLAAVGQLHRPLVLRETGAGLEVLLGQRDFLGVCELRLQERVPAFVLPSMSEGAARLLFLIEHPTPGSSTPYDFAESLLTVWEEHVGKGQRISEPMLHRMTGISSGYINEGLRIARMLTDDVLRKARVRSQTLRRIPHRALSLISKAPADKHASLLMKAAEAVRQGISPTPVIEAALGLRGESGPPAPENDGDRSVANPGNSAVATTVVHQSEPEAPRRRAAATGREVPNKPPRAFTLSDSSRGELPSFVSNKPLEHYTPAEARELFRWVMSPARSVHSQMRTDGPLTAETLSLYLMKHE